MKQFFTILFFFSALVQAYPQNSDLESLKRNVQNTKNDTLRILLLDSLAIFYTEINPDSSFYYADQERLLCQRLNFGINEALALRGMGYALVNMGNYPRALQVLLSGLQLAEDQKNEKNILPPKYKVTAGYDIVEYSPRSYRLLVLAWVHFNLGILYENAGNHQKEFHHYSQALQLGEQINNPQLVGTSSMNLGRSFLNMKKPDSALLYEQKAYEISQQSQSRDYLGSIQLNLARIYLALGNVDRALANIRQAILHSQQQKYFRGVIAGNLLLSNISVQKNSNDSGFYFAKNAVQLSEQLGSPDLLLRSYNVMAGLYKSAHNNDSAVKYQSLIIKIKDSLFNSKQTQQFQNIDFDAQERQKEIETAKRDYRNRVQKYGLLLGLVVFVFTAVILWRNNRNKQRAYSLLKIQKQETDAQKAKVEKALDELKSVQAQLIQQEKMASLGQLTAGIAHEIQNPLNFVNNFSDVNTELVDEAKQEMKNGKFSDVDALLDDIKANEEKINHHGKRADAIVRGMLQHSRPSSGQKELTDINKLVEEYVKLAYHGMRAKDQSFNAQIKTEFDSSIGKVNIVAQEIGRVLLNLINNAFYAVNEKERQNLSGYEPTVVVTTKRSVSPGEGLGDVVISVKDNGNGVPQKILDKIFQPFFTTKPTGQGTGLGLSLAYDIVKAHGGEIKVETKEGEGAKFMIKMLDSEP